jgi:hypothetical protein
VPAAVASLMVLAVCLAGCIETPTAFQKETGDAASTYLAAAEILRLRHQDKATRTYVVGSFENFRDALATIPTSLPKAADGPGEAQLQRLLQLHATAWAALQDPCLDRLCDWQGQLDALEEAGSIFMRASKGL